MDKNYERNPEKAKYIKEQLYDKYQEDVFQKYEISEASLSRMQVCNLAEFLMAQQDKYERNRAIYERDENLTRIYVVADPQKDRAILINTNEKGKVPEGEFGTYYFQNDFQKEHFEISGKVKDEIVKHLGIGALPIEKQDEMINEILYQKLKLNELSAMDQLATMDLEKVIDNRIPKKEIEAVKDKYIDGENERNGKTKEEREAIENKINGEEEKEEVTVGQEPESKVPDDVEKACRKLGITEVKSYFYVNANELSEKVDGTRVSKNGNRVLMLEVADSSNLEGPNKYYGMQDEKMVLYGTENQEVRDLTGNVTQMGKVVKPLKLQSPEYIEYQDSEGLVIREQIDDKSDLSVQEIERYKKDMEKTLEKYSQNIYMIKYNSNLSPAQKIEQIQKIDDWCDKETTQIALQNNISLNDDKNIDKETDEHTEDMQEDIEAWEVPGSRKRGE